MLAIAFRTLIALLLAIILGAFFGATLSAAETANSLPVPTVTIYPGDVIRSNFIVERDFSANITAPKTGVIADRSEIVGKVARRTLLPGVPIPGNAVMEPRLVTNGGKVKVVFREGGMTITTYAAAMQAGGAGDVVTIRNMESGLIISGTVQPDGSVRVGGS